MKTIVDARKMQNIQTNCLQHQLPIRKRDGLIWFMINLFLVTLLSLYSFSSFAVGGEGGGSAVGNGFVRDASKVKCGELKGYLGKESKTTKKLILIEPCKVKNEKLETEFKPDSHLIVDEKGKLNEVKK